MPCRCPKRCGPPGPYANGSTWAGPWSERSSRPASRTRCRPPTAPTGRSGTGSSSTTRPCAVRSRRSTGTRLDGYAAAGVSADKPVLADRSDAKVARMSASVMHLRDHLDEVPVLVLPLIAGPARRREHLLPGERLGLDHPGRLEPDAVAALTRSGQRVDDDPPAQGGRHGRAARHSGRLHAGRALPGRVHDRYGFR